MSKTPLKRAVQISTSLLVILGFMGMATVASAEDVLSTAEKTEILQLDVESLSNALLAEVRQDLDDRLRTENALAFEPAVQADTLQAITR